MLTREVGQTRSVISIFCISFKNASNVRLANPNLKAKNSQRKANHNSLCLTDKMCKKPTKKEGNEVRMPFFKRGASAKLSGNLEASVFLGVGGWRVIDQYCFPWLISAELSKR